MFVLENEWLRTDVHLRGAALTSLILKPLNRQLILTLSEAERLKAGHYFGTIVGPVANRIAGGQLRLGGKVHQLDQNEGQNTLHGGQFGLSEVDWLPEFFDRDVASFRIDFREGQSGFPFSCQFHAKYELAGRSLSVTLGARPGADCAINIAPHFYFAAEEQANEFEMQISAEHYLPVNSEKIPTGKVSPVADSEFDFRQSRLIDETQIDHNFCLDSVDALTLSGRDFGLDLKTNQKGLQIYTADHLGRKAVAIEPQGWPNAVNEPSFPSQWIDKNGIYENRSEFHFSVIS